MECCLAVSFCPRSFGKGEMPMEQLALVLIIVLLIIMELKQK